MQFSTSWCLTTCTHVQLTGVQHRQSLSVRSVESEERRVSIQVSRVAACPVAQHGAGKRLGISVALVVHPVLQKDKVGAIRTRQALAVIVVGVCVGTRPPGIFFGVFFWGGGGGRDGEREREGRKKRKINKVFSCLQTEMGEPGTLYIYIFDGNTWHDRE